MNNTPLVPKSLRKKPQYSIILAPLYCWFSPGFYKDIARNRWGIGFWYLFLLFGISFSVYLVSAYLMIKPEVRSFSEDLKNNKGQFSTEWNRFLDGFPAVTVENGILSTQDQESFAFSTPIPAQDLSPQATSDKLTLFVIDPYKKIPKEIRGKSAVLITNEKLIVRNLEPVYDPSHKIIEYRVKKSETHYMKDVPNSSLTSNQIKDFTNKVINTVNLYLLEGLIAGYLISLPFLFLPHFLAFLVIGIAGLLFSAIFRRNLSYSACLRLTAMSLTPVVILTLILETIPLNLGYYTPIFIPLYAQIGIFLLYLMFAVFVSKERPPITQSQPPSSF